MTFSGYAQIRLNEYDSALDNSDGFDLRRVRLKCAGTLNGQGTRAVVQIDLSKLDDRDDNEVVLKDAFVQHPFTEEWSGRLGYTTVPFGFEEEYSASKRLPLERSKAARTFFSGDAETGLYALYTPREARSPELVLGYSNGLHDWGKAASNGDQDREAHAWLARVQWKLPHGGAAGVSYQSATRDRTVGGNPVSLDNNCLGAHLRWNGERGLGLQGEYYTGEILSVDSSGWYAQIEYAPGPHKVMPFYRYDEFEDGIAGHSMYRAHTLGAAYEHDKNGRVTVQWEQYDDLKGGNFGNFGLQYQFKYSG
jgi:hypothetical protein